MWHEIDFLRGISVLTIAIRIGMVILCGGIIGIERELKRRPAGFRTHILICAGAALTTLTSQYLGEKMGYTTDLARLGAQVIAGTGFVGAGTIIVTRHQKVRGLTTAAGLWTTAIIGLAIGAGFYEGACAVTFLIVFAELIFSKFEYWILHNSPEVHLFVEYENHKYIDKTLEIYRKYSIRVLNMQIISVEKKESRNESVIFSLRLNKRVRVQELKDHLLMMEGIVSVVEI